MQLVIVTDYSPAPDLVWVPGVLVSGDKVMNMDSRGVVVTSFS